VLAVLVPSALTIRTSPSVWRDWSWQASQVALADPEPAKCDDRAADPGAGTSAWQEVHASGPASHATGCDGAPNGLWQPTEHVTAPPEVEMVPPALVAPPGNVTVVNPRIPPHAWQTAHP
jgi:hypothetical protein